MARLIFLGPPGAGKGTQAQLLAELCTAPHISTGDILRTAVADKTELGQKAHSFMERGELVPDELMLGLVRDRLKQLGEGSGWILDGFPRTVLQAEFLDSLLVDIGQPLTSVVNLDVPDEVLVTRLLARGRSDDNEAVIRNRLQVYRDQTLPLIQYYQSRDQLLSVDGDQPIETVTHILKDTFSE